MRVILIVPALFLFLACHADAQLRSDKEQNDLAGAVHTVRLEKSPVVEEGPRDVAGPRESSETTYNKKGNKTEEIKYGADNSVVSRSLFDYDMADNLIAVTKYNADGSIYLKKVRRSIEGIQGRRIEESILANGTAFQAKTVYAYDSEGRETELASFDANGKLFMRLVTIYGAHGKPTETEFFDDKLRMGKIIFSYDAQGNPTGSAEYDSAGVRGRKYVFSGDLKKGSQIEMAEYDENDILVNKESYVREFDSLGNWTKETKSKLNLQSGKFEPVQVTHRIITYY